MLSPLLTIRICAIVRDDCSYSQYAQGVMALCEARKLEEPTK